MNSAIHQPTILITAARMSPERITTRERVFMNVRASIDIMVIREATNFPANSGSPAMIASNISGRFLLSAVIPLITRSLIIPRTAVDAENTEAIIEGACSKSENKSFFPLSIIDPDKPEKLPTRPERLWASMGTTDDARLPRAAMMDGSAVAIRLAAPLEDMTANTSVISSGILLTMAESICG